MYGVIFYIIFITTGLWVHCNDSRLSRCSSNDVLDSQAYVLFYARRQGRSPVMNRECSLEERTIINKYKRPSENNERTSSDSKRIKKCF